MRSRRTWMGSIMVTIGIDGTQTHLLARLLQQLDRADAMPAKPVITVVRTLHLQDRRFGMLVSRPQMGVGSTASRVNCPTWRAG